MDQLLEQLVAHSGLERAGAGKSVGVDRNLPPHACHAVVEALIVKLPGARIVRERGENLGRRQLS